MSPKLKVIILNVIGHVVTFLIIYLAIATFVSRIFHNKLPKPWDMVATVLVSAVLAAFFIVLYKKK